MRSQSDWSTATQGSQVEVSPVGQSQESDPRHLSQLSLIGGR